MTAVLVLVLLAVVVGALVLVAGAQRRAEEAQRRSDMLLERSHRLEHALGVAEQALRSLAHDTRLDAGMAVEIDSALRDVQRAASDDGRGLGY